VGQDRRRLAQQRVGPLLSGLLARRVLGHVALAGLQPVVGGIGQRVERQAQALALLLALLALGRVALALGAALGLVEREILLLALGAELRHVLDPPLELRVLLDPLGVPCLQSRRQRREVAVALVRHGRDLAPFQRVVV